MPCVVPLVRSIATNESAIDSAFLCCTHFHSNLPFLITGTHHAFNNC
jgi:hypothetical protein